MAFTYGKLYRRIRESTGLDVLTAGTMQAIVENSMADLASRGYRDFTEVSIDPENLGDGLYCFDLPEDTRRILYLKVAINGTMHKGLRLSVTDDRINNVVTSDKNLRTAFTNIEQGLIFYTNNDKVYFELRNRSAEPVAVRFGYDRKITVPSEPDVKDYEDTIINVRREYEDAIVLYGIYQIYNRYGKEFEKIQMALNNYKYYVEDITATVAHEDDYDREQGTKILEHM
jgi:hypothetical protein